MPITQISKSYQDMWGTSTNFLRSNAGDLIDASFVIQEIIQVTSSSVDSLTNDVSTDEITWLGGDFEEEGFRVGDSINITTYEVLTGVVLATTTTTIDWVNGDTMKVASTLSSWYSSPDEAVSITANRNRESMELEFNMVQNGATGSEFSLIDGEVTRFTMDLTGGSPSYTVTQVGNKSGAYDLIVTMGLNSQVGNLREYTLRINLIQSGLYNSNLFNFNNCLKVYAGMRWSSLLGEPFNQTVDIISEDADTGWFNQPFNTGVIDAVIVQQIGSLAYDSTTTGQFVIDSASSNYAVGSAYISSDESYYKNQPESQSELTMLIPSSLPISGVPNVSANNPDGAGYTLEITGISTAGTIHTIDFEFIPNADFTTFMESRADGDRTFYIWMKYGNLNLLVFSGQLSKAPPVTQNLSMVVSDYFDHSQNITDSSELVAGYSGNVEDDFGFVGKFRVPKKSEITFLRIGIQAYNLVSEEYFTLEQSNFSFTGIPQDSTPLEAYILNEEAPVIPSLPDTSVKKTARLERDASIDLSVNYGIKIYYPYLYRWENWLSLPSADSDFYPDDQTRNWVPYGTQGDWRLRMNLELDINDDLFQYRDEVVIKDYDDNPNIDQEIQLWRDNPLTQVQVVIEDELMRIVALHTNVDGSAWEGDVWGMITIEPTESSPRWISSTAIDYDGNLQNPLSPLSGLRCDLTFPSPDVARLECYFDSTKINLTNGVSITAKIKGCNDAPHNKITTSEVIKVTTSGDTKDKT